jgi:hypothetical protein
MFKNHGFWGLSEKFLFFSCTLGLVSFILVMTNYGCAVYLVAFRITYEMFWDTQEDDLEKLSLMQDLWRVFLNWISL